jgi:hypothetical protein
MNFVSFNNNTAGVTCGAAKEMLILPEHLSSPLPYYPPVFSEVRIARGNRSGQINHSFCGSKQPILNEAVVQDSVLRSYVYKNPIELKKK